MRFSFQYLKIPFLICTLFLCIGFGVALFMTSPLFSVTFVTKETHLELGTNASTDPSFYLEGSDWCVALSYVDTSAVRKAQIGRYPITIYHGLNRYTCYVNVTDTLPPVLSCDIKQKTIKPGDNLSAKGLGIKIKDASEIKSIGFCKISSSQFYTGLPEEAIQDMIDAYKIGIEMWAEDFQFSFGGIYTMTIQVTDIYNNSSQLELDIVVEEPPVINAPTDIYLTAEATIDYRLYMEAWDFLDEEFCKEDVTIDSSQVSLAKSGVYPLSFHATDNYGLSSTFVSHVHVCTQMELQELINTHKINVTDHVILGAPNPYDAGVLEGEDYQKVQEFTKPALVQIENDKLSTAGRGFIIHMDDNFVTIATSQTLISGDLEIDVSFHDGNTLSGVVVASESEKNIAFIRIPVTETGSASSLSTDYIPTLRTVHMDYGYWKEHSDLTQNLESHPTTTGSPVFDGYGHLLGMYTESSTVPLEKILDYYELVFKRRVEYQ